MRLAPTRRSHTLALATPVTSETVHSATTICVSRIIVTNMPLVLVATPRVHSIAFANPVIPATVLSATTSTSVRIRR